MAHITGEDRSQLLLLPDAVDDYVGPDNPVRFIDAFVDGLDLEAAGFQRVRPNDTGRPGYDPADLLKLYIYGSLNRIRSSRRLATETHRNLEAIWLLRQLKPDFKTIADFRRDNRHAFRAVFRQFVRLCRELDLYGRELIAVDGTRIKAVNHRDRNFTRAKLKTDLQRIDDRLDRYLDQVNEADADDAGGRAAAVADLQEKIASIRKRKETLEGWLYLCVILDLYSRRVVGWAMSARIDQALTVRALSMALEACDPGPGLIHHSDRGSQPRFKGSSQHYSRGKRR